jgi:hypothetical protein
VHSAIEQMHRYIYIYIYISITYIMAVMVLKWTPVSQSPVNFLRVWPNFEPGCSFVIFRVLLLTI